MSFFSALLGAINQGANTYNDEQDFQRMMMKDKVGLDSTRAKTKLTNQIYAQNEQLNPTKIEDAMAILTGRGLDNDKKQRAFDWAREYLNNSLTTPDAARNYKGLIGAGSSFSPTNQATLDNKNTMVEIANAMAQKDLGMPTVSVGYQGQQYSGDTLAVLQNALTEISSRSSSPVNKQFKTYQKEDGTTVIGYFDPETGVFTEDTSNIAPMGIMNTINAAIEERYPEADGEFDSDANYKLFVQKANEVYQGFITQGMDMLAAEQATKQIMLSMLSEDDDLQFGFLSDRELIYTPQAQGLKIGTIKNGYKFMGGNPNDKQSWEKV